ncbi:hypothetical protein [Microcoleus sp. herbarium14]|uniref:hypothetical protein n=1 Tax=Microcoleus sp. herbarium14 TaxID=3055439 RepID=UPI002FCE9CE8
MSLTATRARHKTEKAALSTAQKAQKKALDNVWKGELKTILFARKNALQRLTSGSGWKEKSAAQKSAEKGAFTRSYASNIANVKASARAAKASLSANHKAARAAMSAKHKSEVAAAAAAAKR